jgi:uncharacterized phage-associated protein
MDAAQEPGVAFDRDKFLATVHFVIEACSGDLDRLGRTKLHKVLYYADMLSYVSRGESLTGVEYIKQPFGPTARYLGWALKELSNSGAIEVRERPYHGFSKQDFILRRPSVTNRLDAAEQDLLNAVIEFVCGFSAKEISEISHAKPWNSVGFGERIPYATAFLLLPQRLPNASDKAWADEVARELVASGHAA